MENLKNENEKLKKDQEICDQEIKILEHQIDEMKDIKFNSALKNTENKTLKEKLNQILEKYDLLSKENENLEIKKENLFEKFKNLKNEHEKLNALNIILLFLCLFDECFCFYVS